MCTREDFFGSGYIPPEGSYNNNDDDDDEDASIPTRDPDSLAERIRRHPDVTNFVAIENAAVPILTFDFEGVNIDLLFARLASPSVPPGIDIDNDSVLSGVDSATEKSLNGPRVTNLIAALARSGSEERYRTFLTVVRLVRKWAKARGLYSNKMGYWGGVNINIAVALVLQLYPNACPASCLRRFFLVFKSWRWPNPVMLTKPHDAELGLSVWNSHQAATMRQVAPMITPAYPAMNSTLSISRQTLQILHEEFCRGHAIVDKLYRYYQRGDVLDDDDVASGEMWRELFEPSDFFIGYPHYLSLCIVGPTQQDAQSWAGFVESRLRKLVSDMLGRSLPLSKVQLWPKKFDACVADRTALLTHAQRANSITYFVGFRVDTLRMRGNQLDVERQLSNFRNYELSRFYPLLPGMDILPRSFTVKELPTICFESYEGGKVSAMKRRRMLIEADPKRQEAKNKKKLAKLKKKMERIQRKKREAAELASSSASNVKSEGGENPTGDDETATEVDIVDSLHKKRKRDDDEGNTLEEDDDDKEEAALLENALDAIEGEGNERKTREEAEIDRMKLLAGELLGDGEDEPTEEQSGNVKLEKCDRILTRQEIEAEILRRAGLVIVSDDEATILGGNRILPWRHGYKRTIAGVKHEESSSNDVGTDKKFNAETVQKAMPRRVRTMIKFNTKFDVVELDAAGRVIDKGDDDFMPSLKWIGRKGGFEFKLGERGVGYYRTGTKVIVPSNMSYS
jgi:poly(A) polymerase